MANRVQHLRHTVTALANFTGLEAEITVNLSSNAVVVHDGITPGGHEQARADLSNVNSATSSVPGKMTDQHVRDLALALATTIQNTIDIATNANDISIVETSAINNAAAVAQNALDISNLTGGQGAYLLLAGGTMTGALELSADPVAALEPATKQYTDLGDLTSETTAKTYTDGLVAALEASKADIAGDTFTGPVILAADPVVPLEAATKQFVESEIANVTPPELTPGAVLHAFQSAPANITHGSLRREYVIQMSVDGSYRIKLALLAGVSGFNGLTYAVDIYVYKNGIATGQVFQPSVPSLGADETFVVSFDVADVFAATDIMDLRLYTPPSATQWLGISTIGLFAAQLPEAVAIIHDVDATQFGL